MRMSGKFAFGMRFAIGEKKKYNRSILALSGLSYTIHSEWNSY
jgi:hypothetical protein